MRAWPVFVPVIVLEALVQALLVLPDPTPEASGSFVVLFVVSLAALLVGGWLAVGAASAAADGWGRDGVWRALRRPVLLAWMVAVGLVTAVMALLVLPLTPIVLVVAAMVLPAAAVDEPGNVFARAYRPVTRTTVRWILSLLGVIVLAAVTWLAALVLGFFITGALAAFVTWLWFAVAATFVLTLWCTSYRRANPLPTEPEPQPEPLEVEATP